MLKFQLTAARRRLVIHARLLNDLVNVSTHSRPKAAGAILFVRITFRRVSTHSRPKAAGLRLHGGGHLPYVSTHSRPKAAGPQNNTAQVINWFQLTAARRRLDGLIDGQQQGGEFQLTAARRRLASAFEIIRHGFCFNSQPPEGGWLIARSRPLGGYSFNSQPPEGGWRCRFAQWRRPARFQLTAARRRLVPPLKPLTGKACIALFR